MTTLRRPSSETPSRAEAIRARRKQRENRRVWAAARTVSQTRAASERSAPVPRRHLPAGRAGRRRWHAAAPRLAGLALPTIALPRLPLTWRMASLTMVMLLGSLLLHTLTSPDYFVRAINLAGSRYVPGEEIYDESGVDQLNAFWLDPVQIRANIEAIPGIQSATVQVEWPNVVHIEVVEMEPVLAWSQGGDTMWIDRAGVAFSARGQLPSLVPILVDDSDTALTKGSRVPLQVVEGALQLKQLRSNIELLHYDSANGLSYQDGRNWRGYFGTGTDMEVKLAVYETLVDDLLSRGIYPTMISVVDKDAPYYRR